MTATKKTKIELIAEVEKLKEEIVLLKSKKPNSKKNKEKVDFESSNLMSFLEHSANHIIIVDSKGIILDINKTTPDLKKEDAIGVSIYSFVLADAKKVIEKAISSVF